MPERSDSTSSRWKAANAPWPLLAAIAFSALLGGPCTGLSQALPTVFDVLQGNETGVDLGLALAVIALHVATLALLWGISRLKQRAVFGYVLLSLIQLAVTGLLRGGTTPLALLGYALLRAPPVVAAYFYSSHFAPAA